MKMMATFIPRSIMVSALSTIPYYDYIFSWSFFGHFLKPLIFFQNQIGRILLKHFVYLFMLKIY